MSTTAFPPTRFTGTRGRLLVAAGLFGLIGCSTPRVQAEAEAATAATGSNAAALKAATTTANSSASCKVLGDFYWEIGDGRGSIVSGSVGSDYAANTTIKIASASKWVWGSYVLEKIGKGRDPDKNLLDALEMKSGRTGFTMCLLTPTVGSCYENKSNSELKPDDVGRFNYNPGHDQKIAVDLGLAGMNSAALTREVLGLLGPNLDISYARPVPAGGMQGTPTGYAAFLRRIINGELRMKDYLGYKPVCTLPRVCATAVSSPVKEAWHYSLNHWIEDDPQTGDGSFSSPGLEGFYPWISADKTTYGIVAREKLRLSAYWESVLCGRDIRKAYFSGKPVP